MNNQPEEFARLRVAGDGHYLRKEYAIAVECYKAAMESGSGDKDFFFNFAYSLAALGKNELAVTMYRDAIRTGSGAAARNNLGLCLRKIGRPREAVEEHLQATRLENSNSLFWRNLAVCQGELKDLPAERSALESLICCYDCTAADWNNVGRAREREGELEDALIAFRFAAYHEHERTYFYNIALMHERLGQTLDAFHACRHAIILDSDYELAAKMLSRLKNTLIGSKPTPPPTPALREIDPQDYLNPYSLLNLNAVDALPDPLEWFEQPPDWEERIGSLTRRRRLVQAGLELDEGRLEWLPEFHITDEVVHRVLSKLEDNGWHAHHWLIFSIPLLNRFLMFGDLSYFTSTKEAPYPLVTDIVGISPDDFEQEDFIAFVSPFFRRRWTEAIKSSLQSGEYSTARTLLFSQAPIVTSDLDEALEPIRRHFKMRRETLKTIETEVEKKKEGKGAVQSHLAAQECVFLNALPGASGARLRDDLSMAYRSLGISLANSCNEFDEADLALKAAESFNASEPVKVKLIEDRRTLAGILQRRQEERKKLEENRLKEKQFEESLTRRVVLKSWLREKTLEITPKYFAWDGQRIDLERITSIRYGITVHYTNGIKTGVNSILAVAGSGAEVSTTWLGEGNFSDAVRSVMGLYSTQILTTMLTTLEQGRSYQIGDVRLEKRGLSFDTGLFKSTAQLVRWSDASANASSGDVYVASRSNPKAKKKLSCRNDWNACMLSTMVEIMKRSPNANGN